MTRTAIDRDSLHDIAAKRAAMRDLLPGLMVLLATQGTLLLADPDATSSGWHLAWALSPLLAIALLVGGQVRILRRTDELERMKHLTAMSIGFGVFAVLLAAVGVLQGADIGEPVRQTQVTFIVGILAWVTALAVIWERRT